jgi:hypothetical protein
MICKPCAFGARMLQQARQEMETRQEESRRAARRAHQQCTGDCCCKHRVVLDWAKLFSVPNPEVKA